MSQFIKVGINSLLLVLLIGIVALPAVSSGMAHLTPNGSVLPSSVKRDYVSTQRVNTEIVREAPARQPMPKQPMAKESAEEPEVAGASTGVPAKVIYMKDVLIPPQTTESTSAEN